MKKPIFFRNVRYQSRTEACKKHQCEAYNVQYYATQNNLSFEDALEQYLSLKTPRKLRTYTVEGKTYRSLLALARTYNIDYGTISYRLQQGWSLEMAVGLIPRNKYSKPVTINGVLYSSINEASKIIGIAKSSIVKQINENNSTDISIPLFYFRGKYYKKKNHLCNEYNCSVTYIHEIEKKYNLSFEEALEKYLSNRTVYTIKNITYNSVPALAKAYHLPYQTVISRLRLGWSIEEAIGVKPREKKKSQKGTK